MSRTVGSATCFNAGILPVPEDVLRTRFVEVQSFLRFIESGYLGVRFPVTLSMAVGGFVIDSMGCESIRSVPAGIEAITNVVRDFYG